ncbi:MAG: hypothetical protein WBD34_23400 [Burkholderiaceae bacterium]
MIPDWMLDAAICSRMTLGEPQVCASALRDLHLLLVESEFPQTCHDSVSKRMETNHEGNDGLGQDLPGAAATADGAGRLATTSDERLTAPTGNIARWFESCYSRPAPA